MIKNRPMLIAAIVFCCFGFVIFAFAAIVFISKTTSIYTDFNEFFGLNSQAVSTEALCQLACIFEVFAFLLGYKSYVEETDED